MPRFLVLAAFLLSFSCLRSAFAQENQVVQAAFEMGRVMMGIGEVKIPQDSSPHLASGHPLPQAGEVDASARVRGMGAWIEERLPLEVGDVIGEQRLTLIGDMPYLPQGKAWLQQSAADLKKAGVTRVGFEILRADHQADLDAYRDGRLSRADLVSRLIGDNDVRFKQSRKLALQETVSAIDALHIAGIKAVALGLSRSLEDQAFLELTGRTKKDLKAIGRDRYTRAVQEIRAPLDQLQSDFLAVAISDMLRDDAGKVVVLASAGRLSKYSTAGRLADEGIRSKTYGFFFPESGRLNDSLERSGDSLRYSQYWAYVPLDKKSAGIDALLLAPAYLPQPQLH